MPIDGGINPEQQPTRVARAYRTAGLRAGHALQALGLAAPIVPAILDFEIERGDATPLAGHMCCLILTPEQFGLVIDFLEQHPELTLPGVPWEMQAGASGIYPEEGPSG